MPDLRAVIQAGVKAVPSVKYAVGVAGVAAAFALAVGFFRDARSAFVGVIAMLALMVLLLIFASVVPHVSSAAKNLAVVMTWSILILFVVSSAAVVSAVLFQFPRPFPDILADLRLRDNAGEPIPGGPTAAGSSVATPDTAAGGIIEDTTSGAEDSIDNASPASPQTSYDIAFIGNARFEFLGSGGGIGPPRWRDGRYALLADVRIDNRTGGELIVREVSVSLEDTSGHFADGEQRLFSLDRWRVPSGEVAVVELQVRTEVRKEPDRFRTRFELRDGDARPRYERYLRGTVTFEVLDATGALSQWRIDVDWFPMVIEPWAWLQGQ